MGETTVGILAVQGAFAEHGCALCALGVRHFQIRQKRDLQRPMGALILPGGESTVMGKLLRELDLFEEIRRRILDGLPVMGTCAGLILLAREVEGDSAYLGTMDIRVKRNAYGRQLGSFYTEQDFKGVGRVPMPFIRAPYITEVSGPGEILAMADEKIVAARQGRQLALAFHPEVSGDLRIHQYFLEKLVDK